MPMTPRPMRVVGGETKFDIYRARMWLEENAFKYHTTQTKETCPRFLHLDNNFKNLHEIILPVVNLKQIFLMYQKAKTY